LRQALVNKESCGSNQHTRLTPRNAVYTLLEVNTYESHFEPLDSFSCCLIVSVILVSIQKT